MSCCIPPTAYASDDDAAHIEAVQHELLLASRLVSEGKRQIDLSVPGIHCGDCIRKIEAALGRLEGVTRARVNLSTKRVSVQWAADLAPPPMIETLAALGYEANVPTCEGEQKDQVFTDLLWALAVAAFASMNIMFLSVSVWSGAAPATRDLFPLDGGRHRPPSSHLFRPHLLCFSLECTETRPDQYGRADLHRRSPGLWHERVRDHQPRPARLL